MPIFTQNQGGQGGRGFHCIKRLFIACSISLISILYFSYPQPVSAATSQTGTNSGFHPSLLPVSPFFVSQMYGIVTSKVIDTLLTGKYYLTSANQPPTPEGIQVSSSLSGSITVPLVKGVYRLHAKSPQGIDLTLPDSIVVTTKANATPILLGTSQGRGRVFSYAPSSKSALLTRKIAKVFTKLGIPENQTTRLASNTSKTQILGTNDTVPFGSEVNVSFKTYGDTNKNGVKDENETYTNTSNIHLTLEKTDQHMVYSLLNGWNLIHFPLKPDTFSTAKELVEEIAREGGYVTTVATWENGAWKEYVQRGSDVFSEDFPIEPGTAYFLRSHQKMDWLVSGTPAPVKPIKLIPGWNSLGLSLTKNQTASQVLDAINENNSVEKVTEIDRWLSGSWQVLVKRIYSPENKQQYGDNFTISPDEGYMIKSNDFVEITVEDQ